MKHLENAFDGYNHTWRYVCVIIFFLFITIIISTPIVIMTEHTNGEQLSQNSPTSILLLGLSSVIQFVLLFFLIKAFHKRGLACIINGTKKIRWNKYFMGAGVWFGLSLIMFIITYYTKPGIFSFNHFEPSTFILLFLMSLLLIPLQAGFEEYMFRGYFAQGIGVGTKNRLLVILIPSIIFALMHSANPEVEAYGFFLAMGQYLLFGLVFGLISVLDDGIEIAMGAHFANNFFLSICITHHSFVIQTPALFSIKEINPIEDLIFLFISSIIFVFILQQKYKWSFSTLFLKVKKPEQEHLEV